MNKVAVRWMSMVVWGAACGALGCASAPYRPARVPAGGDHVPPDVVYLRSTIDGADGVKLLEQCWLPTVPTRAGVVLVHDLQDHSSRYRDLAISFANRGLAVCAIDLRGHGYSAGVRDHISSLESFVQDLDSVVNRVKDRERGKPIFVIGQGYGASLAGIYALRTRTPLGGVILGAPMLRENVTRSERMGIRARAIFLPRSPRLAMDVARYSKERPVVESMQNDALITGRKPTAATAGELLRASDELHGRAADLNVPLLVLLGSADQVSSPGPARALYDRAATSDKKLTSYDGLSHALFHESGRNRVIDDVAEWIAAHCAPEQEKEPAAAPAAVPLETATLEQAPASKPVVNKAALRKMGSRSKRR